MGVHPKTGAGLLAPATEQHLLSFLNGWSRKYTPLLRGADVKDPPMPEVLRDHGVLEEDFKTLAQGCADAKNEAACVHWLLCTWCCCIVEVYLNGKMQDLANEFNKKYETRAVSAQVEPAGSRAHEPEELVLVFSTPASAVEGAPQAVIMGSPAEAACR